MAGHFLFYLLAITILVVIVVCQREAYVLQYLFFLRFPLILACCVFCFPIVAVWGPASPLLRNLFVVKGWHLALVSGLAVLASLTILSAGQLLLQSFPQPYALPFWRSKKTAAGHDPTGLKGLAVRWVHRAASLLVATGGKRVALRFAYGCIAVPNLVMLLIHSEGRLWHKVGWIALGVILAAIIDLGAIIAQDHLEPRVGRFISEWLAPKVKEKLTRPSRATRERRPGWFKSWCAQAWDKIKKIYQEITPRPPWTVLLVSLFFYVAGYFVTRPGSSLLPANRLPALSYLLLLTILLALVLPALSFTLDRLRVPTLLFLVAASLISYRMADSDHYYRVLGPKYGACRYPVTFPTASEALQKRLDKEKTPRVVVVSACGGGISAALWTSRVLVGLRKDPQFGDEFGRSLAFVSGVSGGGVGAMYFVNAYSANGPPERDDLKRIRDAARASSLGAIAWGLAYPDLWRVLAPWIPFEGAHDRAWAQEVVWENLIGTAGVAEQCLRGDHVRSSALTLGDWSRGVREGWRPAMVFNSTIVETGQPYLMGSIDVNGQEGEDAKQWHAQRFSQEFGNSDLPVVTAARLSSTFPYVTPISRASVDGERLEPYYHVADGGYFDNQGTVTASDWIREVLPVLSSLGGAKVLLIQVRIAPSKLPEPEKNDGWLNAVAGPVVTLTSVREGSQIRRTVLDIERLKQVTAEQHVELTSVVFPLGDSGPLSWHLSSAEARAIANHWGEVMKTERYENVRRFFAGQSQTAATAD